MTTRHRKRIREVERVKTSVIAQLELRKAGLRAALPRLVEAGRVLSAANEEKLRTAQDAIATVLASLEAPDDIAAEAGDAEAKCETCKGEGTIREGNMECPDCGGSGLAKDVKKEARRERLLRTAESYSSSADDASQGAYIISQLLNLMSEESDEPDELPILQVAFAALTQWLQIEVAEIGTPEDEDESSAMDLWGWEAARKRLTDSGGPITPHIASMAKLREGKPIRGDLVAVSEAALKEDGTGAVKIIAPGWGSSGYYAAEVLERDGPQVFTAGTKMFWDHPTLTEEWERPERSLRDLAGELTSDASWDPVGPPDKEGKASGPGLYANTKVFQPFAEAVNELAPSIGVSIIAYAKASVGEAEGRTGQIIDELVGADSVDFVTFPGAGGQVLQLFEAARQRLGNNKPEEANMDVEKDPKFLEVSQRAARAEEALVLAEAGKVVTTKLAEAQIPDVTRARLAKTLAVNPPAKEGKLDQPALEKRVDEAVKGEIEYLAGLTKAGKIVGMGAGGPGKEEDLTPQLEAAFKGIGLSESAAKHAAAGRR